MSAVSFDLNTTLEKLATATTAGKITAGAEANIRTWLTEPRYAVYASDIAGHIADEKWQVLDDVFWTIIPFGTGGRRGKMYPFGSNAINERTIGESAQGLANYVKQHATGELSCAIAFDTRHRSTEFAKLCAGIMVAAGFKVYFLDEIRSTPALSFLVRYKNCSCGIMVTASHNPPSDNAVKAYWSTGGQLLPPHDQGVIDCVMNVDAIEVADFEEALAAGDVVACKEEVDAAFLAELKKLSYDGPRDAKILYSPLHGVGATAVLPALEMDGFKDVELFALHAEPNGDFPNVPGHVSNPENAIVFEDIIKHGQKVGADFAMASDPDCDRLGCAAPATTDTSGPWATFNGNQIGALLGEYIFSKRKDAGTLTPQSYMITTLVTTRMVRRIAESFGVRVFDNNLVGFKWIGGVMDEVGPDDFVFATEESHGYLAGQHARDKDGAVASMLLAQFAAQCKANGQSLHEKMDELYMQYGFHGERLATQRMEGSEGMAMMKKLMALLRSDPPSQLAGINVAAVRDYKANTITKTGSSPEPLEGPNGDLVIIDLELEGNYIAVRPSGTEPKVKYYMFTYVPADEILSLNATKLEMQERIEQLQSDLESFAGRVA